MFTVKNIFQLLGDLLFFQRIVEYTFPHVSNTYMKIMVGSCLRLINFLANKFINEQFWKDHDCDLDYNQYNSLDARLRNTIMCFLILHKSTIQYFANWVIDMFNAALVGLQLNETKVELNETKVELNETKVELSETKARVSALETALLDNFVYTVPDDLIHESPIEKRTVKHEIDISGEFKYMATNHLHAD